MKFFQWLKELFSSAPKTAPSQVPVAPAPVPIKIDPQPKPTTADTGDPVWQKWLKQFAGKSENDSAFSKFMSQFWKLCKLNYTTIAGNSYAWCAESMNAALDQTGYKGTGSAAASSFTDFGTSCGWVQGAILPIRHANGGRHVTTFDGWEDQSKMLAYCFGGNQSDHMQRSLYNLSGNAQGHDEVISGPRWPIKK